MMTFKFSVRATTLPVLAGIMSLIAVAAFSKEPEPPGLFSTLPISARAVLPQQALAGKSHAVKINHGQLRSGRFSVSLPGGASFEVVRDFHQEKGDGRSSFVGHASKSPGNRVILGISGNAVAGSFNYEGRLFKLEPRADGSQILSEVKTGDPAPELDPIPVADTTSSVSTAAVSGSAAADTSGSVIDVLVAYTPATQSLYGTQGAEALIIQAVAEANQAYVNSKMSTRLNLVRSVLTSYTESGDMNTDLSRLRTTSDGYMDELHALRNSYGADLVSLIENAPQYCGLAYRMATLSASFASSAFSVVHHSCATGYYSFAHEIGHNQGAHHDAANASGAIFPYAYGYQDPLNRFRTVMSYDCSGSCTRAALFSRGDNPIYGVPTGDVSYAANAVAIDQTAPTVAAFRQLAAPPPAAPADLVSPNSTSSSLQLVWTDRSSNESGFLLERSTDGLNFSQVASLPVNTTAYADSNLQAATLYSYRARAWNSSGNSSYSNVTTAPTAAAAAVTVPTTNPLPTVAFDLSASGYKVNGRQRANLAWSGSQSPSVDILRNGSKVQSAIANTGSFLDNINRKGAGTYTYKICEAGKSVCSNQAVISF